MELLAPAGNTESLIAALRCGADAVYTGGKNFSARQNAANFDFDEMKDAIKLCHRYNAKLYIAVNTMLMDNQLDEFISSVKKYASLSPDAFIVQDLGAAYIIKSIAPDIHIHASTQMTIHTVNGAAFAKNLGFTRVVISREASSEMISEIVRYGIDTEIFVHGALCMSVSGQCYMSAMIGSRSANRGLCAQSCRLPFSSSGNMNENCLSLKDLSLIEHIKQIKALGVTSLKIEGRMKRPEYVAAAVSAYRNAIDGKQPDTETLRSVFSRSGFTDGYFTSQKKNMFGTREKDDVVSSNSVIPQLKKLYQKENKISELDIDISVLNGKPVILKAHDSNGYTVSVTGEVPEIAANRAADNDTIKKQLLKLGDTIYFPGQVNIELDDGLCVPASSLNKLRRNAVEQLYQLREQTEPGYINHDFSLNNESNLSYTPHSKTLLRIRAENEESISGINLKIIDKIIFPISYIQKTADKISIEKEKIIIEPPRFISNEQKYVSILKKLYDQGFRHLMCNNVSYIRTGNDIGFTLHGDFGLNIANSASIKVLSDMKLSDLTCSFELKLSQASKLHHDISCGIIAYGRVPLMLTSNCPIKNSAGCGKCSHTITDRTNRSFSVKCRYDYTEIYNSDTIYLADKTDLLSAFDFITLYFTDESAKDIKKITEEYINGSSVAPSGITRGLYFRGIK